ncbi:uncharacterized protein LOC115060852 [Echeneis naucrates]|uniref:uncharacterized protein LOC115060852 n=1 Tax=Echeneis naucrates TaxID=173247 RepID=UPI0011132FFB|nr:uncharacterized protein LOC115060852 [Echeneis naucrates]
MMEIRRWSCVRYRRKNSREQVRTEARKEGERRPARGQMKERTSFETRYKYRDDGGTCAMCGQTEDNKCSSIGLIHIHTRTHKHKRTPLERVSRMFGPKGQKTWTCHFFLVIWLLLPAPTAFGFFLGDTKAVLNGCENHWTLQDRAAMPLLFKMTVCVDIRVVAPGPWVAFSYSSVHAPRPELGLEGDDDALYGWLLRVRHRFPLQLSLTHWHRVCLRRDVLHNSFSLEVDGKTVAERTVIAQAIPPSGSLWLGCRPRDRPPGAKLGEVELYLFRMWPDLDNHDLCEDGTVIGWDARYWGVTSPSARQRDPYLLCDRRRLRRHRRASNAAGVPPGQSGRQSPQNQNLPGSQSSHCDLSQLCSDADAYFWILLSAKDTKDAAFLDAVNFTVTCDNVGKLRERICDKLQKPGQVDLVCENYGVCEDSSSNRNHPCKPSMCQSNRHSDNKCFLVVSKSPNQAGKRHPDSCRGKYQNTQTPTASLLCSCIVVLEMSHTRRHTVCDMAAYFPCYGIIIE